MSYSFLSKVIYLLKRKNEYLPVHIHSKPAIQTPVLRVKMLCFEVEIPAFETKY